MAGEKKGPTRNRNESISTELDQQKIRTKQCKSENENLINENNKMLQKLKEFDDYELKLKTMNTKVENEVEKVRQQELQLEEAKQNLERAGKSIGNLKVEISETKEREIREREEKEREIREREEREEEEKEKRIENYKRHIFFKSSILTILREMFIGCLDLQSRFGRGDIVVKKVVLALKLTLNEKNRRSVADHLNKNLLKKIKDKDDNQTKKLWGKIKYIQKVEGFPAYEAKLTELLAAGGDIIVMFSGSKTAEGESWCPDCVAAESVVTACLASAESNSNFLHVGVGDRETWQDLQCIFRWAGGVM